MGTTLLASPLLIASALGHPIADVEHLVYPVVTLVDVRKALEARGTHMRDVHGVLTQMFDARQVVEAPVTPARSPRLQTVNDLATRAGGSAADVFASMAAGLPPELAFLRKALEGAGRDVTPLYDSALSGRGGHMTFEAWDDDLKGYLAKMQKLVDTRWKTWSMQPTALFLTFLCTVRNAERLKAHPETRIDVRDLMREMGDELEAESRMRPTRDPPDGHTPGIGPALFATILRAEHYAADARSNVRQSHMLRALGDEPDLTKWVERIKPAFA